MEFVKSSVAYLRYLEALARGQTVFFLLARMYKHEVKKLLVTRLEDENRNHLAGTLYVSLCIRFDARLRESLGKKPCFTLQQQEAGPSDSI